MQEIIHTLALAMKHGLTADDMKDFVYAYSTFTSEIRGVILFV